MADFRLQIVTQQQTVFDDRVSAATLPGEEGSFGVLANHAPIISVLGKGKARIRQGSSEFDFTIGGGFFEMESNSATLLADDLQGLDIKTGEDE